MGLKASVPVNFHEISTKDTNPLQLIIVKVYPYLMIKCRESNSLLSQYIRAEIEISSNPFKHVCANHKVKATAAGLRRGA